jgi:hypothetical protein
MRSVQSHALDRDKLGRGEVWRAVALLASQSPLAGHKARTGRAAPDVASRAGRHARRPKTGQA